MAIAMAKCFMSIVLTLIMAVLIVQRRELLKTGHPRVMPPKLDLVISLRQVVHYQ